MRSSLVVAVSLAACRQSSRTDEPKPASAGVSARNTSTAATPRNVARDPLAGVRHRGLTAGEIAMLKPLFRSSLRYSTVRVVDGKYIPFQPSDTYMTPNGNIYAPGDLYEEDFSAASVSVNLRSVFVHEMTHIWQHTMGLNLLTNGIAAFFSARGDYGSVYQYKLTRGMDLLDYGFEAQASIVQDYFLLATGGSATHLDHSGIAGSATKAMYRDVLRRFLADPSYAKKISPAQLAAKQEKARERARAKAAAAAARGEKPVNHPSCGCAWH